MANVLAFYSPSERTYQSLTPQLETVIEVPTVKVLWQELIHRLHEAKHLPSMSSTYDATGFYRYILKLR